MSVYDRIPRLFRSKGKTACLAVFDRKRAYHGALPRLGRTRDVIEQCRRLKGSRLVERLEYVFYFLFAGEPSNLDFSDNSI